MVEVEVRGLEDKIHKLTKRKMRRHPGSDLHLGTD